MNEYDEQAKNFVKRTGTTIDVTLIGVVDHFPNTPEMKGDRYEYRVTIKRHGKTYTTRFYGSINDYQLGKETVSEYDVLACLHKYDPENFDEFCREFGVFPINSRKEYSVAERTYKSCCREWKAVNRLFPDVLDELREIS